MSEFKKDQSTERKNERTTHASVEQPTTGILKKRQEEDLEERIIESVRKIGNSMTRKEILALAKRIEVSNWLDGLRKEFEKELSKSKETVTEIDDEILKEVLELFKEAKEVAELGIKELKLEMRKLNPTIEWEADKSMHLSSKFAWIKRLEESELGKNIIIDLEGLAVGIIDSGVAIAKLLLWLILDLFLLPVHAVQSMRQQKK